MAVSEGKIAWSIPVVLFTVTNIAIFGVTYGTLTSEMKNFNKSLTEVVVELKKQNQTIVNMKENDIRFKLNQEYHQKRIERIESKIK